MAIAVAPNAASALELLGAAEHEQILVCREPDAGFLGIIAIHNTALGPAVGGTRLWHYESLEAALVDALRLSRGMTYKNALAGLRYGGGKAVIVAPPDGVRNRPALFRAHGRMVERLGGKYITAEDVGTGVSDMEHVHRETSFVAGLASGGGDPSPFTAHGVFRAIQAAAFEKWGSSSLDGRTVALQGCGNVGRSLALELKAAGASLVVSDVDEARAQRVADETGGRVVRPQEIYAAQAHIFAPCALGAIINDETLPLLRAQVVAGGANNQLLEPRHGDELERRGIVYAPDYVANAGGVLSGGRDLSGWSVETVRQKIEAIYDTMLRVFELAKREGIPTYRAADRLAEERLATARR
jgi:leucine dehydrogenase